MKKLAESKKKMKRCKLCNSEKKLLKSHVIPKFVFKWMQTTGGNYFRTPSNPNKRAQDGYKEELLCSDCEHFFSTNEKWFSENVFYPYLNSNQNIILYERELPKFIISILWRILILIEEEENNLIFNKVLNEWKDYLTNNTKPKEFDKIHLMFIPNSWGVKSQSHQYVSRYFNRVADGGIIKSEGNTIVYSKFASFFLFAEIEKSGVNFRGSQIYFESGITTNGQYVLNEKISTYFINRSFQIYNFMEKKYFCETKRSN